MFQRVLWVSLTQVFRSIALVLLPTAFIALLAWASAGSSNANTADPIRAALWIWLAAHHIPFHVLLPPGGESGLLSYLPLGALLLPFFAIRNSFARVSDRIDIGARAISLARTLFAALYAIASILIALISHTSSVSAILYWIPLIILPSVWLVTATVRPQSRRRGSEVLIITKKILATTLGISSLILGIALFCQISTVKNLTVILQPGILGGFLLLLLNLLYVPNAILGTFAYLAGPGFAVGAHTLISPWHRSIAEIPALPFLGALPTGRHPLWLFSLLIFVAAGAVIYNWTISQDARVLQRSYVAIVLATAGLSFLGSGALLTNALRSVGLSTWQVTLAVAVEMGLGIALAAFVPVGIDAVRLKLRR